MVFENSIFEFVFNNLIFECIGIFKFQFRTYWFSETPFLNFQVFKTFMFKFAGLQNINFKIHWTFWKRVLINKRCRGGGKTNISFNLLVFSRAKKRKTQRPKTHDKDQETKDQRPSLQTFQASKTFIFDSALQKSHFQIFWCSKKCIPQFSGFQNFNFQIYWFSEFAFSSLMVFKSFKKTRKRFSADQYFRKIILL